MADLEEDSSDSSDEDYVPGADSGDEEVSEEKDEDGCESGEEQIKRKNSTKSKKRKLKNENTNARKRKGGIRLENEADELPNDPCNEADGENPCNEQNENGSGEKEKERVDALWASFMQDVEFKPKLNTGKPTVTTASASSQKHSPSVEKPNKVTVTKVYDFAGEEIRVTEQVDANSKEAKLAEIQKIPAQIPEPAVPTATTIHPSPAVNIKRPAGLSGVLNKISGKKKLSTLDKSLLDWKDFKVQEGIDEELTTFNKGKDGYLEKQAFLERADQRQFEVEKSLRMANRSNR